jgi:hypothetical protein
MVPGLNDEDEPLKAELRDLVPASLAPLVDGLAFTDLQRRAIPLMKSFVTGTDSLLLMGPAGCGKSMLADLSAAATRHCTGKSAVIALPQRALVTQVFRRWQSWVSDYGLEWRVYAGSRDYREDDRPLALGRFDVAILVYEKLVAFLSTAFDMLDNCGLLVVDELHKVADQSRGARLQNLLAEVRRRKPELPVLGVTIPLGDSLEGIRTWLGEATRLIETTRRPVRLEVSVCESPPIEHPVSRRSRQAKMTTRPSHRLWQTDPSSVEGFVSEPVRSGWNLGVETQIVTILDTPGTKVLVFAKSRRDAELFCNQLWGKLNDRLGRVRRKQPLNYARAARFWERRRTDEAQIMSRMDVALNWSGRNNVEAGLRQGVCYHSAALPRELRELVEDEFLNPQGLVHVLVATDTLAEGINLPADVVIIKDLITPTGIDRWEPLGVNNFRNKAGRAGRLGHREKGEVFAYLASDEDARKLAPGQQAQVRDLDRCWQYYVAGKPEMVLAPPPTSWAASLVLRRLVEETYKSEFDQPPVRDMTDSHVRAMARETMKHTLLPLAASPEGNIEAAPADVDRILSVLQEHRLVQVGEPWQLTKLGLAVARAGMSVDSAPILLAIHESSMEGIGAALEPPTDPPAVSLWSLGLLFQAAEDPSIRRLNWIASRPEFHIKASEGIVSLVRGWMREATEQGDAVLPSCLKAVVDVPEFDGNVLTRLLRALVAWWWAQGDSWEEIRDGWLRLCGEYPRWSPADLEQLADLLGYVLSTVREELPPPRRANRLLWQLATEVEAGVPLRLFPLAKTGLPAFSRHRLAQVRSHIHPSKDVIDWLRGLDSLVNSLPPDEDETVKAVLRLMLADSEEAVSLIQISTSSRDDSLTDLPPRVSRADPPLGGGSYANFVQELSDADFEVRKEALLDILEKHELPYNVVKDAATHLVLRVANVILGLAARSEIEGVQALVARDIPEARGDGHEALNPFILLVDKAPSPYGGSEITYVPLAVGAFVHALYLAGEERRLSHGLLSLEESLRRILLASIRRAVGFVGNSAILRARQDADASPPPDDSTVLRLALRRAVDALIKRVADEVSQRETVVSGGGKQASELIRAKLEQWRERHRFLLDVSVEMDNDVSFERLIAMVEEVDQMGVQCVGDAWQPVRARAD